jgi:hypothetical protein
MYCIPHTALEHAHPMVTPWHVFVSCSWPARLVLEYAAIEASPTPSQAHSAHAVRALWQRGATAKQCIAGTVHPPAQRGRQHQHPLQGTGPAKRRRHANRTLDGPSESAQPQCHETAETHTHQTDDVSLPIDVPLHGFIRDCDQGAHTVHCGGLGLVFKYHNRVKLATALGEEVAHATKRPGSASDPGQQTEHVSTHCASPTPHACTDISLALSLARSLSRSLSFSLFLSRTHAWVHTQRDSLG